MVDRTITVNVIITGASYVGKSAITGRLAGVVDEEIEEMVSKPTIGADLRFKREIVVCNGEKVVVNYVFYDLGGSRALKEVRRKFFEILRSTSAKGNIVVAVYSLDSSETLISLSSYVKEALDVLGEFPLLIVGNKLDLVEGVRKRTLGTVLSRIGEMCGRKPTVIFTSAKTKENMDKVLEWLKETVKQLL